MGFAWYCNTSGEDLGYRRYVRSKDLSKLRTKNQNQRRGRIQRQPVRVTDDPQCHKRPKAS